MLATVLPIFTIANANIGGAADGQLLVYSASSGKWQPMNASAVANTVRTFADATARGAATPDYVGQPGTQLSDDSIWISSGTGAGAWSAYLAAGGGNPWADSGATASALGCHANCGALAQNAGSFSSGPGALDYLPGQKAFANGFIATAGDAQGTNTFLFASIATTSPIELAIDGSGTRFALPTGKICAIVMNILVAGSSGSDYAQWQILAANASGTTTIIATRQSATWINGSSPTVDFNVAGAALTISLTFSDSNSRNVVARLDSVETIVP